jgi:hypothetical protein
MNDVQIGRLNADVLLHPVDRGQNLLVHSPIEPQFRQIPKQLDVINGLEAHPGPLFLQGTQAVNLHDITQRRSGLSLCVTITIEVSP